MRYSLPAYIACSLILLFFALGVVVGSTGKKTKTVTVTARALQAPQAAGTMHTVTIIFRPSRASHLTVTEAYRTTLPTCLPVKRGMKRQACIKAH